MAGGTGAGAALCSERFGSQAARGCSAAADGSLRWEAWGRRWWGGAGGAPGPAAPPLPRLLSVFLPQGFPDSVSPDYLPYQLWDSVQAFASSLSGSLATHAVLLGIGVGNASASVSAATATWLLKDSTGMLGRIIFAWWKGSKLDCNAKQWRLFADILNDIAMFLEIMAPVLPICFTMTICISNLAKPQPVVAPSLQWYLEPRCRSFRPLHPDEEAEAQQDSEKAWPCRFRTAARFRHALTCIVSVAGGATRAALTMHQARRNNMADVSAKDGSQETLVNLAGLLVSLLMLPLVSDCPSFSLGCFFLLTALHVYANYRAVRALVIETLNEGRLWLVLKHFLQRGEVLDPTSANQMEPLWTGFWPSPSLSLGVPLHRLVSSVVELQQLAEGHQEPYLLRWDQSQNQVQVVLSQVAGPETVLRAATHGLVLGALREDGPLPRELGELRSQVRAGPNTESWVIVKETHRVLDELFPEFLRGLQDAGWDTEKHQLEVDEWRATWLLSPEKKVL